MGFKFVDDDDNDDNDDDDDDDATESANFPWLPPPLLWLSHSCTRPLGRTASRCVRRENGRGGDVTGGRPLRNATERSLFEAPERNAGKMAATLATTTEMAKKKKERKNMDDIMSM